MNNENRTDTCEVPEEKKSIWWKLLENPADTQHREILGGISKKKIPDIFGSSDTSLSNDIDGAVHVQLHSLLNIRHAAVLACMKIQ